MPAFFLYSGSASELDDQIDIIGLYFGFIGGAVTADLSAFIAFMDDDISFFGIGFGFDRAQDTAARIRAVSGIDIHVERAETAGAVVARAVTEGLDSQTAIFADEGIVIFCESFLFHNYSPFISRSFIPMIQQSVLFVKRSVFFGKRRQEKNKPLSVLPKGEIVKLYYCCFISA